MTQACAPAAARHDDEPRLQVRSRFANVDVDARDLITFPDGVPGYEGRRQFVLLEIPDLAPLRVLHAVDAPEPCFLVLDPTSVLAGFRCEITAADRLRLEATDESVLLWLAIVTVSEGGEASANLRAPIVVNPERMIGRQVMPNGCVYPLQHALAGGA